jgi:hypothetical protein
LFPEYTGKKPEGLVADCIALDGPLWLRSGTDIPCSLEWQQFNYGRDRLAIKWAATCDSDALYIIISDSVDSNHSKVVSTISDITIKVEPRRLWPCARFVFNTGNLNKADNNFWVIKKPGKWFFMVRIPFKKFLLSEEIMHPLRIDVQVQKNGGEICSWCPNNPLAERLVFGTDNPVDLGWLLFSN